MFLFGVVAGISIGVCAAAAFLALLSEWSSSEGRHRAVNKEGAK